MRNYLTIRNKYIRGFALLAVPCAISLAITGAMRGDTEGVIEMVVFGAVAWFWIFDLIHYYYGDSNV